jgi:hypothetical protein
MCSTLSFGPLFRSIAIVNSKAHYRYTVTINIVRACTMFSIQFIGSVDYPK